MNVKFVDRKEEQPRNVHFYAEKKVAKLDRFFRSDAEATITFTPQKKGMVKAEVAVNAGGALYRGESTTSDATLLAQEYMDDEVDDINIIRSKKFTIKPMSPEEAVLQMNLTGHTFFVFRNADNHDAIAVVYARNNGGYGLIEDSAD